LTLVCVKIKLFFGLFYPEALSDAAMGIFNAMGIHCLATNI
jgi:hypothetical protein